MRFALRLFHACLVSLALMPRKPYDYYMPQSKTRHQGTRQRRSTYKPQTPRKRASGVTADTPKAENGEAKRYRQKGETPSAAERLAKRNELLAALAWANAAPADAINDADRRLGELVEEYMTEHGPGPAIEHFGGWPVVQRALEAVKLAWAERERLTLRRILDTIMGSTPGSSVPTVGHARLAISLECDREGQIIFRRAPEGPVALFTTTLQGLDAQRFGRCQVCARYYYAPRLLPDGKPPAACPPPAKCARILRTRRHRAKQEEYELTRKLKT